MNKPLSKYQNMLRFFESFILLALICIGLFAALKVGLNYDEDAEFRTYLKNIGAINGLAHGSAIEYQDLTQYFDRYYGVGFHLLSFSIGAFLHNLVGDLLPFSQLGSRLIWSHAIIFLTFIGSGILVRSCILKLTSDKLISFLGMFAFLFWPYLFGHGTMNIKDVPFMFAWLCCTFQMIRIFEEAKIKCRFSVWNSVFLGIFTGWLISIRVSGVLICIQYFWIGVFLLTNTPLENEKNYIKKFLLNVLIIVGVSAASLFVFFPILWHNPIEIIKAIQYMSSHPWQGNTLTAGQFIEPKTRLIFYMGAWFLVKLPVFILMGLLLTPIAIWKALISKKLSIHGQIFIALFLSVISTLMTLIIMRVALYNELRQILFIFPLLLIISIAALYVLSKKGTIFVLLVTVALMVVDGVKLYPYGYTYINEIARFSHIGRQYETDYYGLSVRETARWLNNSQIDGSKLCLYVPSLNTWKYEINPGKFPCVGNFPGDLSLIKEPFLFFVHSRSVTSFHSAPWCRIIHTELAWLAFMDSPFKMGELYECRPPI